MIGTLIRKIAPNQKWPSRKPLITGPNAPAAPVTLAQMAIAFGRSCAGKMLMMIDSVDGMISAAATPISARHAISRSMLSACDARTAPTAKSARPVCSAPLRPNRSPSAPVVKSRPANTSE